MKTKVIASAGTIEDFEKMYNEKCYSTSWTVKEVDGALKLYNTKLDKYSDLIIRKKNGRIQLCMEV